MLNILGGTCKITNPGHNSHFLKLLFLLRAYPVSIVLYDSDILIVCFKSKWTTLWKQAFFNDSVFKDLISRIMIDSVL